MQATPSILWIILHLRKCGGTTLNGHFKKNLSWDDEFVLLDRWGIEYRETHQRPRVEDRNDGAKRRIRVISGHKAYYCIHYRFEGRPFRYLALMREPASRIVSAYNFARSRGVISEGFHSWYFETYRKKHANFCVRFYAERLMPVPVDFSAEQQLAISKALFDRCWFVLVTECLDEDLGHLFRCMNLPDTWENYRVAGEGNNRLAGLEHPREGECIRTYYELDDRMRQRIYDDNPYDVMLYDYALGLNRKRKSVLQEPQQLTRG